MAASRGVVQVVCHSAVGVVKDGTMGECVGRRSEESCLHV